MENKQFWKLRAKHGRDLIFSTPEILWESCQEYFESVDNRKWHKTEFHGKDALECKVPNETPYTWTGLYLFLDIAHKTWQDYEKRDNFIAICTRVRNIIYTQKFEGASVGAFHPMIISRDLGLKDSTDITSDNKPIEIPNFQVLMTGVPLAGSEDTITDKDKA